MGIPNHKTAEVLQLGQETAFRQNTTPCCASGLRHRENPAKVRGALATGVPVGPVLALILVGQLSGCARPTGPHSASPLPACSLAPSPSVHPLAEKSSPPTPVAPAPSTPPPVAPAASAPVPPKAAAIDLAPLSKLPFKEAWPTLHQILATGDPQLIDSALIDGTIGLHVLDNPGAIVIHTHHSNFSAAFPKDESRPAPVFGDCTLRKGAYPQFSCNDQTWSPPGCIHTTSHALALVATEQSMVSYQAERPPTKEDRKAWDALRAVESLATDVVTQEVRWFFGRVGGSWKLIAVDVVTPCSA